MEPEKRLSLPEWQDKIVGIHFPAFIHTGYKAFKSWPSHKKYLANVELEALEKFHKQEVAFLQSQIPQWVSVETDLPVCFEKGDFDGLRSDFVIVETKEGEHRIARLYKGQSDGSKWQCWYCVDDYEVENVVQWKKYF